MFVSTPGFGHEPVLRWARKLSWGIDGRSGRGDCSHRGHAHSQPAHWTQVRNNFLKVWWHYELFLTFIIFNIHSSNTIMHSLSFIVCQCPSSSIFIASPLSKRSLLGGAELAENRTRACLTASRRTTNWVTPHLLNFYDVNDGNIKEKNKFA